jgi:hypothetical protein
MVIGVVAVRADIEHGAPAEAVHPLRYGQHVRPGSPARRGTCTRSHVHAHVERAARVRAVPTVEQPGHVAARGEGSQRGPSRAGPRRHAAQVQEAVLRAQPDLLQLCRNHILCIGGSQILQLCRIHIRI